MFTKKSKPELLAPAGSLQAFNAALMAGADAIYLGLSSLNARRNADNFGLDDLAQLCDKAHIAGRRVYLTLNTLILDDEIEEAVELAAQAWQAGIDAAIVADWGLLTVLARALPQLELHASTQMNIHTASGIELAGRLGATRVTLARELSLEQVASLTQLGLAIEVFAHGALCICSSGQCLMSSLIGRRSANRGLCAQPCRLPWTLGEGPCVGKTDSSTAQGKTDDDKTKGKNARAFFAGGFKDLQTPGEHLLSPKDLCTIDILPKLIAAGVSSLKIEGRMKSPEYVAMVVGAYRSALDRAYADPEHYSASAAEHEQLEEAFSRGFSTAYLEGERGAEMMSYQRPNNRGVMLGRVAALHEGLVEIACERALNRGDLLEFWTSRGRHTHKVDQLLVDGKEVELCKVGQRASFVVDRPVARGDRVFRVRNARFIADAQEIIGQQSGAYCTIDIEVSAHLGEPLAIRVSDEQGRSGEAQGPLCEKARTRDVSRDDIEAHVGRLGGTPYRVGSWDIKLDEGLGMGFSQLHALRREALAAYEKAVLKPWHERVAFVQKEGETGGFVAFVEQPHRDAALVSDEQDSNDHADTDGRLGQQSASAREAAFELGCIVASPEAAQAAVSAGAEIVYAPALAMLADVPAWEGISGLIPLMPTIAYDEELESLAALLTKGTPTLADSPAMLSWALSRGAKPWAGPHCGVINAQTAAAMEAMGACGLWLSPELSLQQIAVLSRHTSLPCALTVFGRQELMVTRHCEFMSQGPCLQNCRTCVRRKKRHILRDRKGYEFPVVVDAAGRGHIYNAVCLDALRFVDELQKAGVSRFIVDASLFSPQETASLVKRAYRAYKAPQSIERIEDTTTGHLFRGVL